MPPLKLLVVGQRVARDGAGRPALAVIQLGLPRDASRPKSQSPRSLLDPNPRGLCVGGCGVRGWKRWRAQAPGFVFRALTNCRHPCSLVPYPTLPLTYPASPPACPLFVFQFSSYPLLQFRHAYYFVVAFVALSSPLVELAGAVRT